MAKKKQADEPYDPEDSYFAVAKDVEPPPVVAPAGRTPQQGPWWFPKVKYHATEPPQTVATPEAEAALGAGWADSPAEFVKPSKE